MFRRLGRTHRSRYANRGWALTRSLAARLLNCWPETESPWKKADKVALQAATLVQNMRPPAWADRRAAAASVRHAGRPADVASEKGWWNVGQPQPIAPAPVPAATPRVSLAELWPREANLALAQACARGGSTVTIAQQLNRQRGLERLLHACRVACRGPQSRWARFQTDPLPAQSRGSTERPASVAHVAAFFATFTPNAERYGRTRGQGRRVASGLSLLVRRLRRLSVRPGRSFSYAPCAALCQPRS
jgi:hypothetical protein